MENPKTGKSKTIKVNWILDEKGDPVLGDDDEPTKDPDVAAGVVKNKQLAQISVCDRARRLWTCGNGAKHDTVKTGEKRIKKGV